MPGLRGLEVDRDAAPPHGRARLRADAARQRPLGAGLQLERVALVRKNSRRGGAGEKHGVGPAGAEIGRDRACPARSVVSVL